jgi:hypothetical protein
MQKDLPFPASLIFQNERLRRFAETLRPHGLAFFDGGILSEPSQGWENVFFHCLSEALTVKFICEKIPNLESESLVLAAFLHDAYKRREVEAVDGTGSGAPMAFLEAEAAGKNRLRALGYPEKVVGLQAAFGDLAARQIYLGEISALEFRLLHYVDDVTHGDQIVSVEERMAALERNPRYEAQNQWHRQFFNGQTLYQAKRHINRKTEAEIALLLGLGETADLPEWLKNEHRKWLSEPL